MSKQTSPELNNRGLRKFLVGNDGANSFEYPESNPERTSPTIRSEQLLARRPVTDFIDWSFDTIAQGELFLPLKNYQPEAGKYRFHLPHARLGYFVHSKLQNEILLASLHRLQEWLPPHQVHCRLLISPSQVSVNLYRIIVAGLKGLGKLWESS